MLGEFDLIKKIKDRAYRNSENLTKGIGDDCAIIRQSDGLDSLISCDLLVEDVHFKLGYTPARSLGHKTLAVSLSDMAAMGGRPRFCTLSLAIPDHINDKFLNEFFDGFFALADRYEVTLIGGDTSRSPDKFVIDLNIIGECPSGAAIRRDGAKAGDLIFVTGSLGASAVGLILLERGYLPVEKSPNRIETLMNRAVQAHLEPDPRVEIGLRLLELGIATSMIDLSDGLSSDLNHICEESRVGARIYADKIPISDTAEATKEDGLSLALNGGEDYELLFTVNPQSQNLISNLDKDVRLTLIGEITNGSDVLLNTFHRSEALLPGGYEHFNK
ncbi:MAG TPA: thiamine-phosphate kinase [Blastocatellia bacterium]|nr:thiamine-phosphate kinase [Blastocatellia bacterium]